MNLPLLWRYLLELGCELRVRLWIDRSVFDGRARRIVTQIVVAFPVFRWPDWPRNKAPTTVGADVMQDGFDAGGAERALVGTDTRLKGIGWQRLVAVFTGGSEFQHEISLNLRRT